MSNYVRGLRGAVPVSDYVSGLRTAVKVAEQQMSESHGESWNAAVASVLDALEVEIVDAIASALPGGDDELTAAVAEYEAQQEMTATV